MRRRSGGALALVGARLCRTGGSFCEECRGQMQQMQSIVVCRGGLAKQCMIQGHSTANGPHASSVQRNCCCILHLSTPQERKARTSLLSAPTTYAAMCVSRGLSTYVSSRDDRISNDSQRQQAPIAITYCSLCKGDQQMQLSIR